MQKAEMFSINVTREELEQFGDLMMSTINQLESTREILTDLYNVLWSAARNADRLEREEEESPCDDCDESCPYNEKEKTEGSLQEENPHKVPSVEELKTMTLRELLQMAEAAAK